MCLLIVTLERNNSLEKKNEMILPSIPGSISLQQQITLLVLIIRQDVAIKNTVQDV